MNKIESVKEFLLTGKVLTSYYAIIAWRYTRLASGINRLRNRGWEIDTKMRFRDDGTNYAEYRLRNITEVITKKL